MFTATRSLLRFTGLRHLRRQWSRTVLSLLGVVMGVSSFIFGPTLAHAIQESAGITVDDIAGRAALEVRATADGFSAELLAVVQQTPGVQTAAPLSHAAGLLAGEAELIVFFGINPALDRDVRSYTVTQGEFLSAPGGVLLTAAYAREKGLNVGQAVTLVGSGGSRNLRLVGLLANSAGVARLNGGDIAVLSLDDALAMRGEPKLDSIAILPAPGQSLDALAGQLRAVLPETVKVESPVSRTEEAGQLASVANGLMYLASLTVLTFGSLLIYNTMAVTVAQRRAEIGVLRALGVERATIRAVFLAESAVLGVVGSAVGVAVGYGLVAAGRHLPVLPADSSSAVASTAEISVPVWLPFPALLAGTVVSLLAGYLPSRTASRVDPVEAMNRTAAETGFLRLNRRRIVGSSLLLVTDLAVGLTVERDIETFMITAAAVYMLILAGVLLFPPTLSLLGGLLPGLAQRLFGLPGLIAAGNLTKRPKRIVATGALLMLGVWAGIVASGSNFGYRDFVEEWDAAENVWSLSLSGAGRDAFSPVLSIPPQIVREIAARPDVEAVAAERYTTTQVGGDTFYIRALDIGTFRAQKARLMWNAGDERTGYARLQDARHPAALAAGMKAGSGELAVGSRIAVETPGGPVEFEIIGWVFGALAPDRNTLVLDRDLYRQLWKDERIDRLLISLKPGSDVQAVRRDLTRRYALSGLMALDNAELRAAFIRRMDSITVVSRLMSVLLSVIVVGGLASTLFIVVLDRRREIGMLRAVGMLRRQITASVVVEAALLVLIACLFGVPLGVLSVFINSSSLHALLGIRFNWVNPVDVLAMVALALATALAAAYLPARRAGRTDVLEAMRVE